MPSIGTVLRDEIARLSRKEARSEGSPVRKASAAYRRDIAALKRQVTELQRRLGALERTSRKNGTAAPAVPAGGTDVGGKLRFVAKGFRAHRARLDLSQSDMGRLFGVSGQTIANWEGGTTKPGSKQLQVIATVRGMGKREVLATLAQMSPREQKLRVAAKKSSNRVPKKAARKLRPRKATAG